MAGDWQREERRFHCAFGSFAWPDELPEMRAPQLVVRETALRVVADGDVPGRVVDSAFLGENWRVLVDVAGEMLRARSSVAMTIGEACRLRFDGEAWFVEADDQL